jgi:hypothetical protein
MRVVKDTAGQLEAQLMDPPIPAILVRVPYPRQKRNLV